MSPAGDAARSFEPSRLLFIEDVVADADLIVAELRRAGLEFMSRRVQSEAALRDALRDFAPDVVLSDHSLPQFTARDALRVVHAERPHTPVIIVTGSLDEETAAEYIKAGAVDYVVKHRLFRLASAVRRALALRQAQQDAARAEAARLRSEHRFRKLVEYSSDVITLLDADGRIVYSTQALKPTLGYERDELTGHAVFTLVHPDDLANTMTLFRGIREAGQPVVRAELRARHKDGSWRDLEIAGANHLSDAVIEAIVVNSRDVTDHKRAQAALHDLEERHRQAQKMDAIGRLASGVAHDFNNILTVITTSCELVLEDEGLNPAVRSDLLEIRAAAERGAGLTRQLLAFSRRQPVSRQRVDLNELVAGMTGMLQRLLPADVRLHFIPAPGTPRVRADSGQLEQVVMNLVVNARDAMPQGGRLNIAVSELDLDPAGAAAHGATTGPYVMLSVQDTGTGMDADTKTHLFEPFFTTKSEGQGTGLGLATVYGIVQQTAGFIDVESESGRGSTFRVYLPPAT